MTSSQHPVRPCTARPVDDAGTVIISLDFEMNWGMHHVLGRDSQDYRTSLAREPEIAERLLKELLDRGIRATWATVGAIACTGWKEYWRRAPAPPAYQVRKLAVGHDLERSDPGGALHFAPATVERIARAPGQDLGCHTFSHVLCARPGSTADDLELDAEAFLQLWRERFGAAPRSFVYPCNESCFADRLASSGFRVVRTLARPESPYRLWRRVHNTFGLFVRPTYQASAVNVDGIRETVGSAFVRFDLPGPAWALQAQRIRSALRRPVAGRCLHLWWHPHNLGAEPVRRIDRARTLLDDVAEAMRTGPLRSCNMADLDGVPA